MRARLLLGAAAALLLGAAPMIQEEAPPAPADAPPPVVESSPATKQPGAAPPGDVPRDPAVPREVQVEWQPWSRKTFALAARLRRPVLLYLRAVDCRLCVEMETTVLTRQDLVRAIHDDTVPVAVDVDLRPDLAARYVIGSYPTLTFLLPNGEPIYNVEDDASLERLGGYFTSAVELHGYLDQTVAYFQHRGRDLAAKAREVAALQAKVRDYPAGPLPLERLDEVAARIRDGIDFTHGGFGRTWKVIADAPYRVFRLLVARQEDAALRRAVLTTAESMLAGEIHDGAGGGFHHFATTRAWGVPALEKRLAGNARALRLLVAAAALDPERRELRAAAAGTADFMLAVLRQPDGGFAFGQLGFLEPGDPGSYFQVDAEGRKSLRPPALDDRQMAPDLAAAAAALLEAGALLDRDDLERAGLAAVDRLAAFYQAGRGMAHSLDAAGGRRHEGLLVDQAAGLEAFLAAAQMRAGDDLERAVDVFRFCMANLRREAGYFVDRIDDRLAVGMLRRPLVPFDLNGRLALAGHRLTGLTGDTGFGEAGEAALGALAAAIPKMDWQDAPYLEALLAAGREPLRILLVAAPGGSPPVGLSRAARLLPVPGLVVVPPGGGGAGLRAGLALPGGGARPGAYACDQSRCLGPVVAAADLPAALAELRQVRQAGAPAPPPEP